MTNFRKLTTAAAALAMGTLLSTGAFAMDTDVTCGDFNAMDAGEQHATAMKMQGPKGGKDYEQDKARGGDTLEEGAALEGTTSDTTATTSNEALDAAGKDGQQAIARGADETLASMIEYCKGGDDLMVRDARNHPSEGKVAK